MAVPDDQTSMLPLLHCEADSRELAELIGDHNVAVSASATYVIKKLDTDYFEGS